MSLPARGTRLLARTAAELAKRRQGLERWSPLQAAKTDRQATARLVLSRAKFAFEYNAGWKELASDTEKVCKRDGEGKLFGGAFTPTHLFKLESRKSFLFSLFWV